MDQSDSQQKFIISDTNSNQRSIHISNFPQTFNSHEFFNKMEIKIITKSSSQSTAQSPSQGKTSSHNNKTKIQAASYSIYQNNETQIPNEMTKIDYYYINPLIELLGYFILYNFKLGPKFIPFQSQITKKVFIITDEIDQEKFKFCRNCSFDESLQDESIYVYYQLRMIHYLFKIDDFHQENVAISGEIETNGLIKRIDAIQVVDLWPTRRPLTFQKLLRIPKHNKSFEDRLYSLYFKSLNERYINVNNNDKQIFIRHNSIILSCRAFQELMGNIDEFKEFKIEKDNNNTENKIITIQIIQNMIEKQYKEIEKIEFPNKEAIYIKYVEDISLNISNFYKGCAEYFIKFPDLFSQIYGELQLKRK